MGRVWLSAGRVRRDTAADDEKSGLVLGARTMLYAQRHGEELARTHAHLSVAQLDDKLAVGYKEHLVLIVVSVPARRADALCHLIETAVRCRDDLLVPELWSRARQRVEILSAVCSWCHR